VGDADMRVNEDYLRILRFFRFLAWYGGDAKVDAASLRACRDNRAGLKSLSVERVWSETKKLPRSTSAPYVNERERASANGFTLQAV